MPTVAIAAPSPRQRPCLSTLPCADESSLNRNGDGSTLYIGMCVCAVYAAPTLRRPNIAVTIEDRASPSFGEVTSSLNRNGDGSILYIGSVSVCTPPNKHRTHAPP